MLKALMNFLSLCWKPFGVDIVGGRSGGDNDGGGGRDGRDGLLWYRDLGKCASGEFSMAVVQANQVLEDQSQIECGPFGTFVGVYDGHGGPEAARFVCDHLFRHLQAKSAETDGVVTAETIKRAFRATEDGFLDVVSELWSTKPQIATVGSCCLVGVISQHTLFVANLGDSRAVLGRKNANTGGVDAVQLTSEHNANEEAVRRELRDLHPEFEEHAKSAETDGVVTAETIKRAFRATEDGFLDVVSELWSTKPQIATVGSCCLVGVISQHTLFVANLGDSRAVLGRKNANTGGVDAVQLTSEHNANEEAVRRELRDLHPDDPQIVMLKHGVWRVKGIIQVSRSIGDVYMKHAQYNREPINAKFRLSEPIHMPILTAIPSIVSHHLQPNDSFLIFASDGLWEHLSNETAVDIVHSHPHAGSAKRLVKAALHEAARKREMRFSDLQKIDKKVRRHFHDDISVIVLFFNHDLIHRGVVQDPPFSIRSALEH